MSYECLCVYVRVFGTRLSIHGLSLGVQQVVQLSTCKNKLIVNKLINILQ